MVRHVAWLMRGCAAILQQLATVAGHAAASAYVQHVLCITPTIFTVVAMLLLLWPGTGTSSDEPSVLRRVVVALGAAEWRTVLVRKRAVTISVQLSTGPAGKCSSHLTSPTLSSRALAPSKCQVT